MIFEKAIPKRRYDCAKYSECLQGAALRDELVFSCGDCSEYKKGPMQEVKTFKRENGIVKGAIEWNVDFDTLTASLSKGGIYAKPA